MKGKKYSLLLLPLAFVLLLLSCQFPGEGGRSQPSSALAPNAFLDVRPDCRARPDFSRVVFVGDSLCAGFQSNGLGNDAQVLSYPAQVASKLGITDFQQPLIGFPGISIAAGQGLLAFDPLTGSIAPRGTYTDPMALLLNATLARPYDNLGVPGARLGEMLRTTSGANGNAFFDLILRGLGTAADQAASLHPTLAVVWAGNNDVLAAATSGGNASLITPVADFGSDFVGLVDRLRAGGTTDLIVIGIPDVADIPYVNALDDHVFVRIPPVGRVPVVFDAAFNPIDFDPDPRKELYIPLLTDEGGSRGRRTQVSHVLLPFVAEYLSTGLGVPGSSAITDYLVERLHMSRTGAAALAAAIEQAMIQGGLNPSGIPIPGNLTITYPEEQVLQETTDAYNRIIRLAALARRPVIPVISARRLLYQLSHGGVSGFTGTFVWFDPMNTAFSLDGVHPNNAGYGIVANALIDVMNTLAPDAHIPSVDLEPFRGQYLE
jgi:lysophospholipase L1-like esterase